MPVDAARPASGNSENNYFTGSELELRSNSDTRPFNFVPNFANRLAFLLAKFTLPLA